MTEGPVGDSLRERRQSGPPRGDLIEGLSRPGSVTVSMEPSGSPVPERGPGSPGSPPNGRSPRDPWEPYLRGGIPFGGPATSSAVRAKLPGTAPVFLSTRTVTVSNTFLQNDRMK